MQFDFVNKTSKFRGGVKPPQIPPLYAIARSQ